MYIVNAQLSTGISCCVMACQAMVIDHVLLYSSVIEENYFAFMVCASLQHVSSAEKREFYIGYKWLFLN